MGVTYNIEEKKFVFDFEHDGVMHNSHIRYFMAGDVIPNISDITNYIQRTIDSLHKKINLYKYDLVVMPEKRNWENQYMMRYIYRFNQPRLRPVKKILNQSNKNLCATIKKQNILIIDDVTTSGSTLNEILRTLRILNEDNEITIFSLIGRKDLMAEAI